MNNTQIDLSKEIRKYKTLYCSSQNGVRNIINVCNNLVMDGDNITLDDIKIFDIDYLNLLLFTSFDRSSVSIAEFVYALVNKRFKFGNCEWYEYSTKLGIWEKTNEVRNYILGNIVCYYTQVEEILSYKITQNFNKIKTIKKTIASIKKNINDIVNELIILYTYRKSDFTKKLDTNKSLICFKNGVLDVSSNRFMTHNKKNYISQRIDYKYDKNFEKYRDDIECFFEKLFDDREVNKYFLLYMGSLLDGGNRESFNMLIDKNAKNVELLCSLLENTLGEYYVCIASDTKLKNINKNIYKKLIIVLNGIHSDLNILLLKHLISNNECNKNYKLIYICSEAPEIKQNTIYTCWDKCRCINLNSTPLDHNKLNNWHKQLFLIMHEQYIDYDENGFLPTESMKKCSIKIEYSSAIEYFKEFAEIHIRKNDDKAINWSVLKVEFGKWDATNSRLNVKINSFKPKISIRKFKKYLNEKHFKIAADRITTNEGRITGWDGYELLLYDSNIPIQVARKLEGYVYIVNPNIVVEKDQTEIKYGHTHQIFRHKDNRKFSGEPIYKIGGTGCIDNRIHGYAKGSSVLAYFECDDWLKHEKIIKQILKDEFKMLVGKGDAYTEYFEGDYEKMLEVYKTHVKNFGGELIINKVNDNQLECERPQKKTIINTL
jgi:hypothetical protein